MENEHVQEVINAAFPELPIPKPRTILGYIVSQDRSSARTFQRELAGKSWQELTPEFLTRWASFERYLSPEAYCYYMPALLIGALKEVPNPGGLLHSMVYYLRPDFWSLYYEGEDTELQARQSVLTTTQYSAVCACLGLAFNQLPDVRHRAAQALHWGWNRVDTPSLQAANLYYRQLRTFVYPEPEDPEIAQLYREIGAAFAATPYPGDDNLSGSDQGDESAEIAMELRGLKWQSAHPELLARCYTGLSFLTDAGYRYFLPAYLLADLSGYESNANPVFGLTCGLYDKSINKERMTALRAFLESEAVPLNSLGGTGISSQRVQEMFTRISEKEDVFDWREYSERRFMPFNREERKAIIHYLEYRAKDEFNAVTITQALEGYWRPSVQSEAI